MKDPSVKLGSYVLFETFNIESKVEKLLEAKVPRVISVVKNIFDDRIKMKTINDLAGKYKRRGRRKGNNSKRKDGKKDMKGKKDDLAKWRPKYQRTKSNEIDMIALEEKIPDDKNPFASPTTQTSSKQSTAK